MLDVEHAAHFTLTLFLPLSGHCSLALQSPMENWTSKKTFSVFSHYVFCLDGLSDGGRALKYGTFSTVAIPTISARRLAQNEFIIETHVLLPPLPSIREGAFVFIRIVIRALVLRAIKGWKPQKVKVSHPRGTQDDS